MKLLDILDTTGTRLGFTVKYCIILCNLDVNQCTCGDLKFVHVPVEAARNLEVTRKHFASDITV